MDHSFKVQPMPEGQSRYCDEFGNGCDLVPAYEIIVAPLPFTYYYACASHVSHVVNRIICMSDPSARSMPDTAKLARVYDTLALAPSILGTYSRAVLEAVYIAARLVADAGYTPAAALDACGDVHTEGKEYLVTRSVKSHITEADGRVDAVVYGSGDGGRYYNHPKPHTKSEVPGVGIVYWRD